MCHQNCTLFTTNEDTCLHFIYSGFFFMSHSCILARPTPAYLFHFQHGKHINSTTNKVTLPIFAKNLAAPDIAPCWKRPCSSPQTKEKLKAGPYAAGKVSVVDPLLKLGDAQQSAGRAWRALHWAAGQGEAPHETWRGRVWKLENGTCPTFFDEVVVYCLLLYIFDYFSGVVLVVVSGFQSNKSMLQWLEFGKMRIFLWPWEWVTPVFTPNNWWRFLF